MTSVDGDQSQTDFPEDRPPAGPSILVIFGAAGDLTRRLLLPALYNLKAAGLLPENFAILGVARAEKEDAGFRSEMEEHLREFATVDVDKDRAAKLLDNLFYVRGDFDTDETFAKVKVRLEEIDQACGTGGNYLFYLATAENYFAEIPKALSRLGLLDESNGWRRVIVEKPFGHGLKSARELNTELWSVLKEEQIYRIDHYLGKETVQNIMVFRFANGFFEPIWNREHIDHIQITVAETVAVETRGAFYDKAGALRDMIPNHMFQLLAMTAMEPPTCFEADAVRNEKNKVIQSIRRFTSAEDIRRCAVRGQYVTGMVGGKLVGAYREADRVDHRSRTETYAALKLTIDNWRWAGMPFYLRTGKALPRRTTEIAVQFKQAPFAMFRDTPVDKLKPNRIILHIQPDEGINLSFGAKVPGPQVRMKAVDMQFRYKDFFDAPRTTGYETLIYDCMMGDGTLYQRADFVEAGWSVVQPVLDYWASSSGSIPFYEAGSSGPAESDAMIAGDGRRWRDIAKE